MNMKKMLALVLALVMMLSIVACAPANNTTAGKTPAGTTAGNTPTGGEEEPPYQWVDDGLNYSYRTYNTVSPSNWCELTYQDANDSTLISYTTSSFFTYDFKFDEYGEVVPGEYVIKYMAATGLEDVIAEYAADWGLLDAEGNPQTKGYAFKITLREDLKWQNGDPIVAGDFVYTMQEQLNPLFQNYRADSYYAGSVNLVGARDYVKQGQSGWFNADGPYSTYSTDLDSSIIFAMGPVSATQSAAASFRAAFGFPDSYDAAKTAAYLAANYLGGTAFTTEVAATMEGKTLAEIKADETMNAAWEALIGFWQTEPNEELDFFITHYTYPEASWDNVGLLALYDYTLVVIMTDPLELLDDAKRYLKDLKERLEREKEQQAELERKRKAIRMMNTLALKSEITTFINKWLTDMLMERSTAHYWLLSSLATTLFNVRSWDILGPSDGEWSHFNETVIVSVESTKRGGIPIRVNWKVKLLRSDNDMKWRILSVDE